MKVCLLHVKVTVMKYPIGIQNFESLRKDGYLYLDKTAMIYRLAQEGRYFFLSRPRRFGKSLLISTLEAYFEGKHELFDGLALGQLETQWEQHPVLHLDLNTEQYTDPDSLYRILNLHLSQWENLYGSNPNETSPSLRFRGIVERAATKTGHRVVVLVDEYDKPLLQNFGNEELANTFRNSMKAFYSVLKTQDQYIRFALLTGVTKLSKVSVFSDLNNLQDISMIPQYSTLCGITEEEIRSDLDEEVQMLATANQLTTEECYAKLKRYYDGYHFCENTVGVYNPFSLLNTLNHRLFRNYWAETGTPTFLIELLKQTDYDLERLTSEEVGSELLGSIDTAFQNPVPAIYQTGYLTIKDYDPQFEAYTLGFPNKEVEDGFSKFLLSA